MRNIAILLIIAFSTVSNLDAQTFKSTYAIQNVQTGKNLRPYDAGSQDGNKIVLYSHVEWKCMTWQFINVTGNTYQLKNLFTLKTFQPSSVAVAGVSLVQQPLKDETNQHWEFIKQGDNSFLIKLQGTDLYVTTTFEKTNSPIVLQNKQAQLSAQLWKFVEQHPTM